MMERKLGILARGRQISNAYLLKSTVGHKERLEGVFHAGVGGDKYENILYCQYGDDEQQMPGLLDTLQPFQDNTKL